MFILTPKKQCTKCGELKPITEFNKSKKGKFGRGSRCKSCVSQYYKDNQDRSSEFMRKYRSSHSESIREGDRRWARNNPDKVREIQTRYKNTHPERVRESKKNWSVKNLLNLSLHCINRRARIKGNGGKITAQEWQGLKEFYSYTCLCCKRQEPEIKLTLDHVKPIKLGGENLISNAQPLCKSCNSRKGAKWIDYR